MVCSFVLTSDCNATQQKDVHFSILCMSELYQHIVLYTNDRNVTIVCLFFTERGIFKDGLNKGTECCCILV